MKPRQPLSMSRSQTKDPKSVTIIPGLNIQWPWSELLLSGKKTVETRSYAIPEKYLQRKLAIIETPGPRGKRDAGIVEARVIGTITFSRCFRYASEREWLNDFERHSVSPSDSIFAYTPGKEKWGWLVVDCERFEQPMPAPKRRGIVFATECIVR